MAGHSCCWSFGPTSSSSSSSSHTKEVVGQASLWKLGRERGGGGRGGSGFAGCAPSSSSFFERNCGASHGLLGLVLLLRQKRRHPIWIASQKKPLLAEKKLWKQNGLLTDLFLVCVYSLWFAATSSKNIQSATVVTSSNAEAVTSVKNFCHTSHIGENLDKRHPKISLRFSGAKNNFKKSSNITVQHISLAKVILYTVDIFFIFKEEQLVLSCLMSMFNPLY